MLDNLRGMAVFASVVKHGSFSGAAKDLGITTSAISQQIRSLENDLGVVLLHRSTRKLSLTEAGESLYEAAKEVVHAAEQGRIKISQLRDDLTGVLRIATPPELANTHLFPALANFISNNQDLTINFIVNDQSVDMIDKRLDIAIRFSPENQEQTSNVTRYPLAKVSQVLLASPNYLKRHDKITTLKDLESHALIHLDLLKDGDTLDFNEGDKKTRIKMKSHIETNSVKLAIELAKQGYGLVHLLHIDAQKDIEAGNLIPVLTDYSLPKFDLYAATLNRAQQPVKVTKCLEVITHYFDKLAL